MAYNVNELYFLDGYGAKRLSVNIEFKVEDDDIFQLFYRDSVAKLNEKMSQKISVKGSNDFQWVKFSIPDTIEVAQIRYDFGNKHKLTPLKIRKFILRYNGNSKDLSQDSLMTYFRASKYVELESNLVFGRKKIEKRSDPYLLSKDLRPIVNELKQGKNYSKITLNIFLSLLLSFAVVVFVKQNNKSRNVLVEAHKIFVCSFLALIILPFLDKVFLLDDTQIQEKRELMPKPVFTYEHVNEYPEAFENYFNDNFGFRNKLISYGGILKAKLFNTSVSREKVIIGKDNWLFYWEEDIRNSYLKKKPFLGADLGRLGVKLKEVNEWALERDKTFLVTIYPNKHTIYEDKIPLRYKILKEKGIRRVDQTYLFLNNNNINNVEQAISISGNRGDRPLYLKNDSHWNSLGAFYAYRNIIRNLSSTDRNISNPLEIEDFEIEINEDYRKGDLLNLLGVDNKDGYYKDSYYKFIDPRKQDYKYKYNVYGKRSVVISNPNANNSRTALFIGDSYTHELLKFLPAHFNKTIFVRSIVLNKELIDKIDPEIVVYGIVERNLENF